MSEVTLRPDPRALGLRDPLYAPRRLTVGHRPDGSILLHNPTPLAGVFDDDAARVGDSGFDHARVSVNVKNIHVADED